VCRARQSGRRRRRGTWNAARRGATHGAMRRRHRSGRTSTSAPSLPQPWAPTRSVRATSDVTSCLVTSGSGRRATSGPIRASWPSRTPSTPRCTSAAATRYCVAAHGPRSRWSPATPSATGTFRSAASSSPASAVPATPEALRAALGALPVTPGTLRPALAAPPLTIEEASVEVGSVCLPSYPDGPRPTSLLALRGAGVTGRAEHVGWSEAAHEAFRDRTLPRVPQGTWRLESWSAAVAGPIAEAYHRAALEAAAIDHAPHHASHT